MIVSLRAVVLLTAVSCLGIGLVATGARSQTSTKPTYTAAQAKQGEAVYTARCVGCHGEHLDDGQEAPPLAGPGFVQDWNDKGLDGLFTFMSTNMPPDEMGGLGMATYADLMAYILSENGIAPSTTELPPDAGKLKGMAAPK